MNNHIKYQDDSPCARRRMAEEIAKVLKGFVHLRDDTFAAMGIDLQAKRDTIADLESDLEEANEEIDRLKDQIAELEG